uniref:Uncharacterized protein n=1 Tax=Brassica oleracea var. oleracea TaxID=109376 RepID=A0A0D3D2U5_BRAOL
MDDLQGSRPYRTESFILPIGDFEGDYFLRFLTAGNLAYSVVLTADLKPRLVELRRRSVTDGVIGDHIFSDCRKMDLPALPQRMYTLGEEPPTLKSISYHTDDSKLFTALRRALNADKSED